MEAPLVADSAPSSTVPAAPGAGASSSSSKSGKRSPSAIAGSAALLAAAAAAVGTSAYKAKHSEISSDTEAAEQDSSSSSNSEQNGGAVDDEVPRYRAMELGLVLWEKDMDINFVRAITAEFIASIIFLFNTIVLVEWNKDKAVLTSDRHLLIALSFGLNIYLLVYSFAGMSGANINPAITTCLALGKRISCVRALCYIGAQCAGAILGTYIASVVSYGAVFEIVRGGANFITPGVDVYKAVVGEIVCTGLLCTIVLVGTNGDLYQLLNLVKMDPQLPMAIAVAIVVGHFVLIPIDVCSINPARSLGPAVVNNTWDKHWVFWVAPLTGAVGAILLWELVLRPPVTRSQYRKMHPHGMLRSFIMNSKSQDEQGLAGRKTQTQSHTA